MSVLIKGVKPPSGCRWCYFNEDCKCALIVRCDFDDTNGTHRRKDCPLIELPDAEEVKRDMEEASALDDEEIAHVHMDGVMCDLLTNLGYEDAVKVFDEAHKWYA